MIISYISLKNWRNFRSVSVDLRDRLFIVGPNAVGKSNFLDALRFLRDLAKDGGGLQKAVRDRGGLSKIRCLYARRYPDVEIEIHLSEKDSPTPIWQYAIGIKQKKGGQNEPILSYERVWENGKLLVDRPNQEDERDHVRLTQTYLEQINANASFRKISEFCDSILYLHLVPQLLRYPDAFAGQSMQGDPFGRNFLERVMKTSEKTRRSRLKKIEDALKIAVPQLRELRDVKDEMGIPHLEAVYEHWRPGAGKQREDQFSDGTLRLIGLLWSLLESDSLLLLEEPELSLNAGITAKLPALIYRLQKNKKRQVILSTHSTDLLSDASIGGEEVLLFTPTPEGTKAELTSTIKDIRLLLDSGLTIADAVLPHALPRQIEQLSRLT
jgi:predicted ATPase